jgi:hypothetical protein
MNMDRTDFASDKEYQAYLEWLAYEEATEKSIADGQISALLPEFDDKD